MNGVIIIPTGIGCEIGGHAGDANPVVKLFASLCDNLITHPNAVNASDINEMTENTLYVEGSILDRFLNGEIYLEKVKSYNKILLVVNKPVRKEIVNAASAARVTIGVDITILELDNPLKMVGGIEDNKVIGEVTGWEELVKQVSWYRNHFDALAISSLIEVDRSTKINYYKNGGINPWGYVEAITSKFIANEIDKPTAHAPLDLDTDDEEIFHIQENLISDPRIAPELISVCYLHSVFKGLHKAPRLSYRSDGNLSNRDIDFLITPYGCVGEPHWACANLDIPIIAVKENSTCLNKEIPKGFIVVDNYLEAAGYVSCMKAGISSKSVRRPIGETIIL